MFIILLAFCFMPLRVDVLLFNFFCGGVGGRGSFASFSTLHSRPSSQSVPVCEQVRVAQADILAKQEGAVTAQTETNKWVNVINRTGGRDRIQLFLTKMNSSRQCCGSGSFILDPNFFLPGSWIPDPNFFSPGCRKYDSDSSFRIRILIFYPSRIPDPGIKKAPDLGSESATLVLGLINILYWFLNF